MGFCAVGSQCPSPSFTRELTLPKIRIMASSTRHNSSWLENSQY